MKQHEFFTSRWGLILSTLGIAVGTGNIWRFSRVVAQNGGGSFLIPWVVFLLIWSLPLIIAEFGVGKLTRQGPVGAIFKLAGAKYSWMGAFVALVTTAIMFYYSVVTGWCFKYFFSAISGELFNTTDHLIYWQNFSESFYPLLFHLFAMSIGALIVYKGIVHGIEKTSKVLVSALIIILFILLFRSITLPGAIDGIKYLFTPNLDLILDYKVWLQALTQNAWDTGAGWGLILTYAAYMKSKEDVPLNASLIGFGNNSVSLIAGIIIFSTVFSFSSVDAMAKISASGPANTGLTFIYLPLLFSKFSDIQAVNMFFAGLFFLALSFAALTSLISMIELSTRTLEDFGVNRKKGVMLVGIVGFLLGIPPAMNLNFLSNQDWVWGIALIISGAFIAFALIKFGVDKFRREVINSPDSDIKVGKWYNYFIKYLIPVQVVILISWWLINSVSWDAEWWNPFHIENAGTCISQWGIFILVFIIMKKKISRKLEENL